MDWILTVVLMVVIFVIGFVIGFVLKHGDHNDEALVGTIIADDSDGELYLFMEVERPELLKKSGVVSMRVSHKN